jgi:hypothetical protein
MRAKVAVESELSHVSDYLESEGYKVIEFQHNDELQEELEDVDAIVTTGMDEDFLGMHDIQTDAIVIEASGLSARDIAIMLEKRL